MKCHCIPAFRHLLGYPKQVADPVKLWSQYGDYRAFRGYATGLLADVNGTYQTVTPCDSLGRRNPRRHVRWIRSYA